MPRMIAITTLSISEERLSLAQHAWNRVRPILQPVPGFMSYSIWKDQDLTERYASLAAFADADAASRSLTTLEGSGMMAEMVEVLDTPPNTRMVQLDMSEGAAPGDLALGAYMSMSVRTSEPGYGGEMEQETRDIFAQLAFIPGYLGAMFGTNVSLAEEVCGLAFWQTREAFQASLPSKTMYEVKLYVRVQ